MRSLLPRAITLIAVVMLPALALVAPASAASQSATAPRSAAAPNPRAVLTGAQITFTTNDEDKDADTKVVVGVFADGAPNASASVYDAFGYFGDNSVHGPFDVPIIQSTTAGDLHNGVVAIAIVPTGPLGAVGFDTWRFNYDLTLSFSDGTSYVISQVGADLSVGPTSFHPDLRHPFTIATQVAVPNLENLSSTNAAVTLQANGLAVGAVNYVIDNNCNHRNTVMDQNPPAGTFVDLGTPVDYTIGQWSRRLCV